MEEENLSSFFLTTVEESYLNYRSRDKKEPFSNYSVAFFLPPQRVNVLVDDRVRQEKSKPGETGIARIQLLKLLQKEKGKTDSKNEYPP